jgi:hypothetical protein
MLMLLLQLFFSRSPRPTMDNKGKTQSAAVTSRPKVHSSQVHKASGSRARQRSRRGSSAAAQRPAGAPSNGPDRPGHGHGNASRQSSRAPRLAAGGRRWTIMDGAWAMGRGLWSSGSAAAAEVAAESAATGPRGNGRPGRRAGRHSRTRRAAQSLRNPEPQGGSGSRIKRRGVQC